MEYYAIYCKTTRKTLEAHYLLENVFIEVYTVWNIHGTHFRCDSNCFDKRSKIKLFCQQTEGKNLITSKSKMSQRDKRENIDRFSGFVLN